MYMPNVGCGRPQEGGGGGGGPPGEKRGQKGGGEKMFFFADVLYGRPLTKSQACLPHES
jgi:hypothetical protein